MIDNKIQIGLHKNGDDSYRGEKDGKYFYIFPASDKCTSDKRTSDIVYWMLVFNSKENFDKRISGEKVNSDMVASIKTRHNEKRACLGGMLFDNKNKKAYFIDITDGNTRNSNYDRYLTLIETVYKEISDNQEIDE